GEDDDAVAAGDSPRAQAVGEGVRPLVELAVGDARFAADQRHLVRQAPRGAGEIVVHERDGLARIQAALLWGARRAYSAVSRALQRSMSVRRVTGPSPAGRLRTKWWCRNCVESTPVRAMLSALENSPSAWALHLAHRRATAPGSKTPASRTLASAR